MLVLTSNVFGGEGKELEWNPPQNSLICIGKLVSLLYVKLLSMRVLTNLTHPYNEDCLYNIPSLYFMMHLNVLLIFYVIIIYKHSVLSLRKWKTLVRAETAAQRKGSKR